MFKLACETRQVSVLRSLAVSSDLWVRRAVAVNPSTPIEVLVMLWRDPGVRGDVESNPLWGFQPEDLVFDFAFGDSLKGLPANVLLQLIKHSDPSVRRVMAQAGLGEITDWLGEQDATIVAEYAKSILLREPETNLVTEVERALESYVGKVPDDLDRERPALFVRPDQARFLENRDKSYYQVQDLDSKRTIERKFVNPCVSGEYPQKSAEELEVNLVGKVAPEGIKLAGSMDDLWRRAPVSPLNVAVSYKE